MPERVLIIDDEENIRQMLRLTFGMTVMFRTMEDWCSSASTVIFLSEHQNRKGTNEPTCFDHR